MTWCQDKVCRSWALPSFSDANSVEHKFPILLRLLVWWGGLVLWHGTVYCIVVLPIIIEVDEITQVFVSHTGYIRQCWSPSHIVPSRSWPKADALFEKIDWGQTFLKLYQHRTWWIEDARGETPNCKLPLTCSRSLPGNIHKSSWVTQTLSKESLKFKPRQKSFDYLVTMLML